MEGIVNTIKDTFDTLTNPNSKEKKEKETKDDSESGTDYGTEDENQVDKTKLVKTTPKSRMSSDKKKSNPSRISKFTKKKNKKNQSKSISYEDALNMFLEEQHNYLYFRSKKKKQVDNLYLNLKKGKKKQCISCKREVGTIFKYEGGIYSAICGASSNKGPCSLDIRIKRSKIRNEYERYVEMLEQIDIIKEDIIRLKLDFMFEFISEVDMVNAFDILRNKLKTTQKSLTTMEQERNANQNNIEIQIAHKSLHDSINIIQNYTKEYNALTKEQERNGVIRDLVTEYVENILPKLRTLRKLQNTYNAQEMSVEWIPQTILVKRNDIELNELTSKYESKHEIIETQGEVLSFIY